MRRRSIVAVLWLAIAATACTDAGVAPVAPAVPAGPTAAPTAPPESVPASGDPTPVPAAGTELTAEAKAACAATTYANCLQSLATAFSLLRGSTVAVCEYADGQGDVVAVENADQAEEECSDAGSIAPSKVVAVFAIP